MPKILEGIARTVGNALKRAGMTRPATLTVITPGTRAPGQATAGTNPTTTLYKARGLVIAWHKQRLGGTDVEVGDRVVLLLGALIEGGAVPKVHDLVTIEGVTSRVVDIERDPAGAGYTLLTRS